MTPLQYTRDIIPLTLDRVASTIISQRVNISKMSDYRFYNHPFNNIMIAIRLKIIKIIGRRGLKTKEICAIGLTIAHMETLINERDKRPQSI